MRSLMRLVVLDGTGRKADAPGYRVGGKTGTAEKARAGGYARNALVTTFAGAFPMDNLRYVVVAMLDEPKGTKDTYGFATAGRSEENQSQLQSLMRISYAVFCLKKLKIIL